MELLIKIKLWISQKKKKNPLEVHRFLYTNERNEIPINTFIHNNEMRNAIKHDNQ